MLNALSLSNGRGNLSSRERGLSVLAGLGLAAAATKPRPNPALNVLALLGGAYLAIRGVTGRCPVKQALLSVMPKEAIPVKAKAPVKRSSRAGRK